MNVNDVDAAIIIIIFILGGKIHSFALASSRR